MGNQSMPKGSKDYLDRVLEVRQAERRQIRDGGPAVFAIVAADENPATEICRDDVALIKTVFLRGCLDQTTGVGA